MRRFSSWLTTCIGFMTRMGHSVFPSSLPLLPAEAHMLITGRGLPPAPLCVCARSRRSVS